MAAVAVGTESCVDLPQPGRLLSESSGLAALLTVNLVFFLLRQACCTPLFNSAVDGANCHQAPPAMFTVACPLTVSAHLLMLNFHWLNYPKR